MRDNLVRRFEKLLPNLLAKSLFDKTADLFMHIPLGRNSDRFELDLGVARLCLSLGFVRKCNALDMRLVVTVLFGEEQQMPLLAYAIVT